MFINQIAGDGLGRFLVLICLLEFLLDLLNPFLLEAKIVFRIDFNLLLVHLFCLGCILSGIYFVWDVFCLGCILSAMYFVWNVFCLGCILSAMYFVCDVFCLGCMGENYQIEIKTRGSTTL